MTLFIKRNGQYIQVSEETEAALRASFVPDGSSGPLFSVENGYEIVHSIDEAAEIRAEWAKNEERRSNAVPRSVTALQMKLELRNRGLLEKVEKLVQEIGGDVADRWQMATIFERSYPAWDELGDALGQKPSDIDGIFRSAKGR